MTRSAPCQAALLTLALAAQTAAQCEFSRIDPLDPELGLEFGLGLAIDGDLVAIGARNDDSAGPRNAGAVHLFERSGLNWFFRQELVASDASNALNLGDELDLEEGLLLAGTASGSGQGQLSGVAYVFEDVGGTWLETAKLTASDGSAFALFGSAVALDDRTAFVGAPEADPLALDSGAVYVFEEVGGSWTETQVLVPSGGGTVSQNFGSSLAAEAGRLFVAAIEETNVNGNAAGAVYVFESQGGAWNETARILPAVGQDADRFGSDLAVDGDVLLVGAENRLDPISGLRGAAYVFRDVSGTWVEEALLTPSDPSFSQSFGRAVGLSGSTALVGAATDGSISEGALYVYESSGTTWQETDKLAPDELGSQANFGTDIDTEGDLALVCAFQWDDFAGNGNVGAVWSYSIDESTCPTLTAHPDSISLSGGGSQVFDLDAGVGFGGSRYWLVGSLTGKDPGFSILGALLPITPDDYFFSTLVPSSASPLERSLGTLDPAGLGRARVRVTAGTDPSLAGLTLYHAFAVLDVAPVTILHVSNAVSLRLDP